MKLFIQYKSLKVSENSTQGGQAERNADPIQFCRQKNQCY